MLIKLKKLLCLMLNVTDETGVFRYPIYSIISCSEQMKKIIEKYNEEIIFKTIPLIDLPHERQENYYMPIFEEIECLK